MKSVARSWRSSRSSTISECPGSSEVSERRWLDVWGVLKLAGPRLDTAHLERWAVHVGVSDLLVRALTDAGLT